MRGGVRGPSRSPAAAPGGAPVLRECDVCGTRCVAKRCGRCGRRSYCGVRCQREDWASHRVACGVAPAAACAVCARGGTTTAPPCGHGLCAACEYALSKRRKPGRPKCPRCRAPEQSESALILEDEVPLLRARHAAVVRTDAAEARRLLSRAAERCRAAQAWEAAAARRDAGLEGRRSLRRHAVLADLELGEALLGLGDFDGRPPRVIFCALFWVTTPNRRTRAAQARRRRSVGASRSPRRARRASSRPPPPPFGRASRGRNSKSATPRKSRAECFCFPLLVDAPVAQAGAAHSATRATARADAPWQAHHTLGAAQDRLGEPRAATAAYRAALAKVGTHDAERITVLFNLGRCCRASGDLGDAVKCLRDCLAASPEDGAAARELAVALEAAGDSEAAVATLRKYLVRSPADLETTRTLGAILFSRGDLLAAREVLYGLAHRAPDDVDGLVRLGLVHARLGDAREAEIRWRRALALDPACVEARANLAGVRSPAAAGL